MSDYIRKHNWNGGYPDKAPIIIQSIKDGNDTLESISKDIGIKKQYLPCKLKRLCDNGIVEKYIPPGQLQFPYHYRLVEVEE